MAASCGSKRRFHKTSSISSRDCGAVAGNILSTKSKALGLWLWALNTLFTVHGSWFTVHGGVFESDTGRRHLLIRHLFEACHGLCEGIT
jgi:hypothetical protein